MVSEFKMSKQALGFAVPMHIWKDFFMGVDLLLRPEGTGAN